MGSSNVEVDHEFLPFIRVYKDGKVERLMYTDEVPTSIDSQTGVSTKDVTINHQTSLSARLFLPNIITTQTHHQKLPLLIYFHGGCFCVGSAFCLAYHQFVNSLVAEANIVAVSVEYRLAPEHPVPIAFDDSWEAIQWVISHSKGEGTDPWLRDHVGFGRVFLCGDSSGATISYNMTMRFEEINNLGIDHFKLLGIALIQPFFWGKERIGVEKIDPEKDVISERIWPYACPLSTLGNDDHQPEEDVLRDRGLHYYERRGESGWDGVKEIMETKGKGHVFHLFNPACEESVELTKHLAFFLNK
ncbi:Alpha/beta hydrolase fold-3 [Macleaya cordata]|uniref:Alpha/beta hydrolase fold-3 n=1 Tax=Macleaya cordata TaxID=56857 RepID=A0A200QZD2_MACCD|nr:Alpha/beta hydrolase fold-3 [Macleaya cordata]